MATNGRRRAARILRPTPSFSARVAVEVPHITVYRTDGVNGDPDYNPLFPFKMRGSVDPYGNVIGGANVSNLTYAIDVPIVTNANFDIIVRSDASCANTLVKLDGGMDLNSQMGLGPTNFQPASRRQTSWTCATTRPATRMMFFSATNRRRSNSATARKNSPRETLQQQHRLARRGNLLLHRRRHEQRRLRFRLRAMHHEPDRELGSITIRRNSVTSQSPNPPTPAQCR